MTSLFIHAGFPKTASSTLQRYLFARHSEIEYLGKPFSEPMARLEKAILTQEDPTFGQEKHALHGLFQGEISGRPGEKLVISHEGFLRNTRYGHHDLARTARRIREIFGEGLGPDGRLQVIVTLRRQCDLILSHYAHFVRGTQADFDRYVEGWLADTSSGFLSSLFYDELLADYAEIFGIENLRLGLFEDFLEDRERFIRDLSGILEIDPEESIRLLHRKHRKKKEKVADAYVVRPKTGGRGWGNRLLGRLTSSGEGHLLAWRQDLEGRVEDLYRRSNTRLRDRFGLRLERHGYPMET